MLSDVVSPSSYLTFNVNIAQVLGLVNAVYCAELLDIYAKARRKKKLDENQFFILNRDYVKSKTSIKVDEQYLCDASLNKVGLVVSDANNPDKIRFDVETFMSIIAEEDSKVLNQIYKKVNLPKNKEDSKKLKREKFKALLMSKLSNANVNIHEALIGWLDAIFDDGKYILEETVVDFQNTLFNYAGADVQKALRIITIAKVQGWTNCVWAINSYEDEQKVLAKNKSVRTTPLKVATMSKLKDKKY